MAESSDLMSIGQFSSLARLSVRMLRHYDEHQVLVPAQVDPVTGYRSYASAQLAEAVAVRRLRDVGFGVSAIAALLAARGTPALEHALRLQRGTLLAELRAAQQRLALIETMLTQTKEKTMNSITVETTTLPAMTMVTLRGVIPTYADEGQLWQRFVPELERQGISPVGPGGVIEHDDAYVESDPDESVWLPVAPGTTAQPPLLVVDLPEQRAAMATVIGPYSQISEAHGRIAARLAEHGLTDAAPGDGHTGKVVNRYLNDPSTTEEAELRTEVYRPLG